MENMKRKNKITLKKVLEMAEEGRFSVGSFSPRYTPMIDPILATAQKLKSPVIVQISQKELERYGIRPKEFAQTFDQVMEEKNITVPAVLHLDHTKDFEVIEEAIDAGFTSVMIDASEKPFEENILITKEVVEFAHKNGVSVEAELGRIGTTDFIETDSDEEYYTIPEEALLFVDETSIDALAVSVGTAHGVYNVRKPKVDFERLTAIRQLTPVHLVLHGGSGVPAEMIRQATLLPGGGISKVNIATDLELALLGALNREERMTNIECKSLPDHLMEIGRYTISKTVTEKINQFLYSSGYAGEAR